MKGPRVLRVRTELGSAELWSRWLADAGERIGDRTCCLPVTAGLNLGAWLHEHGSDWDRVLLLGGHGGDDAQIGDAIHDLISITGDSFSASHHAAPGTRVLPVVPVGGQQSNPLMRAGTLRVSRDLMRADRPSRLSALPSDEQRDVERVWRGITDRLVGVALGGGGAWGFSHVSLLSGLASRGVPVDIITGASIGSVVGAYYASDGEKGLEKLLDRGRVMSALVGLGIVHGGGLAWMCRRDLTHENLEDLRIPFYPVATNVETGEAEAIRSGSIGIGVRASGSLPGLITATTIGTKRYVDGGMSNNVPASMLPGEGAQLIIAANVAQRPGIAGPGDTRAAPRTRIGRWTREVDPIRRAKDLFLSMSTLTHQGGELLSVCAHITYDAEMREFAPWHFYKSRTIAQRGDEDVQSTLDRAEAAWGALVHRRGGA